MFIDTHCHLNFKDFEDDADKIIRETLSYNTWMIIVGTEKQTSQKATELANKYENGVFASVGLHPLSLKENAWSRDTYERLANFEKVVAIGEIGLDYYHFTPDDDIQCLKEKQLEAFLGQLLLARHMNLPVIIHCRSAHGDMLEVIKKFKHENKSLFLENDPWGVMHCFSGNDEEAWEYLKLGLCLSYTGIITFTEQYDSVIRKTPNDRFLIETDAPYLTPAPFRGQRNEPLLVRYVAEKIAKVKNLSLKRVGEISSQNAISLFKI